MPATLEITSTSPPTVSEAAAQQAADEYLTAVLGDAYRAKSGFLGQGRWYFRLCYQPTYLPQAYGVGKITVDALTGVVIPLTDEQTCEARESGAVQVAQERGEMARDEHGYLLRYQAQVNATAWLRDHLAMNFSAVDGLFVPLARACWQFTIRFRLPPVGEVKPLGVIDVDARTGKVAPLSRHQQHMIQERVCALIRHRELASAA